jgi:5-methylcytosine-specific restriction endonuclease McrA
MAEHDRPGKGRHWENLKRIARIEQPDCWLCHKPIDWQAHWMHPTAFTLDHVIPKSRGGTDHPDNVRSAHRRCNEERGASGQMPVAKTVIDTPGWLGTHARTW